MIVVLARDVREAELYCLENGIPPRATSTVIVATSVESHLRRVQGLSISREALVELPSAPSGRFYDNFRRHLETVFYD